MNGWRYSIKYANIANKYSVKDVIIGKFSYSTIKISVGAGGGDIEATPSMLRPNVPP